MSGAGPKHGPCTSWATGDQVKALPYVQKALADLQASESAPSVNADELCAEAALAASQVLYELSGRVFTGLCGPWTIRPVSRPTDSDTRSLGSRLSPVGWFSAWGSASSYGSSMPGVRVHYGSTEPPTIRLPYPVREITLVKIDGVVIPSTEYELRDHMELIRIRPTSAFSPTDRYGWPASQIMDLPDTQPGTFSVTFTFGADPPEMGKLAARKLAEYIVLPLLGDTTTYPRRLTHISRQGVTADVTDVMDLLKDGMTGIYEVDLFLDTVNPHRNQRQAAVWSPDMGRPRRQANPSLS